MSHRLMCQGKQRFYLGACCDRWGSEKVQSETISCKFKREKKNDALGRDVCLYASAETDVLCEMELS